MKNHKKKAHLGEVGQKETTALNFQENYNAFRIRCIMLILEKFKKIKLLQPLLQKITSKYDC